MAARSAIVLDIGKTRAKLSLWDPEGRLVRSLSRANRRIAGRHFRALDVDGIEDWLLGRLGSLAKGQDVGAIVPVAHGAAAVLLQGDRALLPPVDYEDPLDEARLAAYRRDRDPFALTGSPVLPGGLNLGAQIDFLERLLGPVPMAGATLVTWPQYWAWRLCGVAATEVSSLGCHSDLWAPRGGTPSALAARRGWTGLLAPLRPAADPLGPVSRDWSGRTGLPDDCRVLCGAHDSNAALLSVRARPELRGRDVTVLSTGTWFVAMRAPAAGVAVDMAVLGEQRDCLVNVDVAGRSVPSARFMGGREAELLLAEDGVRATDAQVLEAAAGVVAAGTHLLPTFAPGVGPFATAAGAWRGRGPAGGAARRAAVSLYLALVADTSLGLVGSRDVLVVEGRFAADALFVGALAALRPDQQIFVSAGLDGVATGALHLLGHPVQADPLTRVDPLALDLAAYAAAWRQAAEDRR